MLQGEPDGPGKFRLKQRVAALGEAKVSWLWMFLALAPDPQARAHTRGRARPITTATYPTWHTASIQPPTLV